MATCGFTRPRSFTEDNAFHQFIVTRYGRGRGVGRGLGGGLQTLVLDWAGARDIDITLSASRRTNGAVTEVLSKERVSLCTPAVADVLPLATAPYITSKSLCPHTTLARS